MEFKYFNQFNLSDELANAISVIISQNEESTYVCKILTVTIPEYKDFVFHSPLDGYEPWGGGLKAFSGAQIQAINEKYGWYDEEILPENKFPYFVVVEKETLDIVSKVSFTKPSEIDSVLQSLCVISESYFGSIDARILIQRFPYLKVFFDYLDEWRAKTGRVTLDKEILEGGLNKALLDCEQIIKS